MCFYRNLAEIKRKPCISQKKAVPLRQIYVQCEKHGRRYGLPVGQQTATVDSCISFYQNIKDHLRSLFNAGRIFC